MHYIIAISFCTHFCNFFTKIRHLYYIIPSITIIYVFKQTNFSPNFLSRKEEYINLIIEDDLYRLDGINRDKHKVKLLLKSLARNESTTVSNRSLKNDISAKDKEENKLINDLETFGFLFEAMVERDLKIYSDSFNAKCYHYQDYQEKEIDSVIELENGEWCAFEIKLGAHQIEKAATSLLTLKKQIETEKRKSTICSLCNLRINKCCI